VLAPYRKILSVPGALAFTSAGFLARLPISMTTLGIVLLVAGRTGSYGRAGAVSAVYIVGEAVAQPVLARTIDRLGQSTVVVPATVVFGLGLVGLISSVQTSAPSPVPHLCALVAGATYPPIGSCVRARWSNVLADAPLLHTAYSFEAVVDETVFIVGPILVTLLAVQVSGAAGLAAVVCVAVVGGLWFASQRATQPPTTVRRHHQRQLAMGWRRLTAVVVVSAALGSLFGSTEVVTVAFAKEQHHAQLTGALLALWAGGSLISGVITGLVAVRATPRVRFRWGALVLALVMTPLPFIPNLTVLAVNLFVGGFAISPTLVATMSLIEAEVPARRLTEGIAWVSTGIGVGLAPGAAIAGLLIDSHGASTAYWVPVVSGLLAAVIAWSTGHRGARTDTLLEPV
jgi:MFS family permease